MDHSREWRRRALFHSACGPRGSFLTRTSDRNRFPPQTGDHKERQRTFQLPRCRRRRKGVTGCLSSGLLWARPGVYDGPYSLNRREMEDGGLGVLNDNRYHISTRQEKLQQGTAFPYATTLSCLMPRDTLTCPAISSPTTMRRFRSHLTWKITL